MALRLLPLVALLVLAACAGRPRRERPDAAFFGAALRRAQEEGALARVAGTRYFLAPREGALHMVTVTTGGTWIDVSWSVVAATGRVRTSGARHALNGLLEETRELDGDLDDLAAEGRVRRSGRALAGRSATVLPPATALFLLPLLAEHVRRDRLSFALAPGLLPAARDGADVRAAVAAEDDFVRVAMTTPGGAPLASVVAAGWPPVVRAIDLAGEPWLVAAPAAEVDRFLRALPPPAVVRKRRNEERVVAILRHLVEAQATWRARAGRYGDFAPDRATLRWNPRAKEPVFVARGYRFEVRASPADPASGWMAVATPLAPGVTGDSHFAIDETGVVRASPRAIDMGRPDALEGLEPAPE